MNAAAWLRMRLASHPCVLVTFASPRAGAAKLSILLGMVGNRVPEESLGKLPAPFAVQWVLAQG